MIAPRQPAGDRRTAAAPPRTVLVVENDVVLGGLVGAVLADAGYAAAIVPDARPAVVRAAVDRLEPACVLLDGGGCRGYGASWELAAWLRAPGRCRR
jgi:DNA-binding response OmpR family regulator